MWNFVTWQGNIYHLLEINFFCQQLSQVVLQIFVFIKSIMSDIHLHILVQDEVAYIIPVL